jgi:hypothetical protein
VITIDDVPLAADGFGKVSMAPKGAIERAEAAPENVCTGNPPDIQFLEAGEGLQCPVEEHDFPTDVEEGDPERQGIKDQVQIDGRIEEPRNVGYEFSLHDCIHTSMHHFRRRSLLNGLERNLEPAAAHQSGPGAEKQRDGAGRAVFSSQLWVS